MRSARDIAKGRRLLLQQRALIDRLQKADDLANAEAILQVMEDMMCAFEWHRDFILKKHGL